MGDLKRKVNYHYCSFSMWEQIEIAQKFGLIIDSVDKMQEFWRLPGIWLARGIKKGLLNCFWLEIAARLEIKKFFE